MTPRKQTVPGQRLTLPFLNGRVASGLSQRNCLTDLHHLWGRSPNQYKHVHIDGTLPYELVALECALAAFVMSMEEEATGLEMRANASLDRLTDKVRPLDQPYMHHRLPQHL